MERQPKRIIQHVILDGVGPISAAELLTASTVRWELWRRMITDAHQERPPRDRAHCLMCGGPVYIRTKALNGEKRPLFAHFAGTDATCPWFTGGSMRPDDARAAQYQGQQESPAHRHLCNLIAELAEADPRTSRVQVDQYRPPTADDYGRYPDVLVGWSGFPEMVFEVQLSRTFQTEISARCLHYAREGLPLIWVLYGVDFDGEDIRQSFRDVLSRHRMNAFLIDEAAVAASRAARTLVLTCRLARTDGSFEPPRLVRLDELMFPAAGLPYVEDRLTPALMEPVNQLRRLWFTALTSRDPAESAAYSPLDTPVWEEAFDALFEVAPKLRSWTAWDRGNRWTFAGVVAVAFSIVTSARGQFHNYATAQDNVVAMLNSRLSSSAVGPYAFALRMLVRLTVARDLLKGTVGTHFRRAIARHDGNLCLEHEPEWEALAALLPEVFDARLRAELSSIGAMPDWTAPVDPEDDGAWVYAS